MPIERAYLELNRLESISQQFEEERVQRYIDLVRVFVRTMRSIGTDPSSSPFIDVHATNATALPNDITERLNHWCSQKRFAPVVRRVCHWHLKFVLAEAPEKESPYEALITLLCEGGDFYVHHGDVCIRDAASVTIPKR